MTFDAGRVRHDSVLMHYSRMSNGSSAPSNWKLSATGETGLQWTPEAGGAPSFGSNSNEVSYANAAGASSLASPADHVHRGVTSIAHASNTYTGPVTLETEGSLYIVRPSANTFRLGSTGTGGGGAGGPSDYVSGPASSGQIIIPGLYGSPDIRVAGTNDDEFDTTDTSDPMTGWTTLGTPTAHDINSTVKSHYYVKQSATAGTAWVGIYKNSPSTPFTMIAKLSGNSYRANYNAAAIALLETGPGKILVLSRGYNGDYGMIAWELFTSRTAFSTSYSLIGAKASGPIWLRIIATSSTNIAAYWSHTGSPGTWTTIETGRNPGFTIASVGLMTKAENGTWDVEAIYDWVRFT
jgi:hypothetical protein